MKIELDIRTLSTIDEKAAAIAGLPEGASIDDGRPFLYAVLTDTEKNEQTALRSQSLDGSMWTERVFWECLSDLLWKRVSPQTYPYIETQDGRKLIPPNKN